MSQSAQGEAPVFGRESLPISAIAFALALLGWLVASSGDRLPILSDYAAHLRAGYGLVFNAGEPVLILFAPLPMLLLAIVPPSLLFAASAALTTGSLYRLLRRAGETPLWATVGALVTALSLPLWLGMHTATPLLTALGLLGLELALWRRWLAAGFALALAALCGPEAIILGFVLLLYAAGQERAPRFAAGWLVPLVIALVGLIAYYGADFWEGLLRFRLIMPSPPGGQAAPVALVAAFALGVAGWWRLRRSEAPAQRALGQVAGTWLVVYSAVLVLLGGVNDLWRFLPAAAAALLLGWLALRKAPFGRAFLGGIAVTVTAAFLNTASQQRTPWYSTPLPAEAHALAVSDPLNVLFVSRAPGQTLISLDGALQPELRRMVERGDRRSALVRYAPEMLSLGLYGQDWPAETAFTALGYAPHPWETDFLGNVWQRSGAIGPFVEGQIDTTFGPDVRLTGFALDDANAQPGGWLRLRLDWHLARPSTRPVFPEIRLIANATPVVTQRDEIAATVLRAGPWQTYHVVAVPADAPPGDYTLELAVIINNGTAGTAPLGTVTIRDNGP